MIVYSILQEIRTSFNGARDLKWTCSTESGGNLGTAGFCLYLRWNKQKTLLKLVNIQHQMLSSASFVMNNTIEISAHHFYVKYYRTEDLHQTGP